MILHLLRQLLTSDTLQLWIPPVQCLLSQVLSFSYHTWAKLRKSCLVSILAWIQIMTSNIRTITYRISPPWICEMFSFHQLTQQCDNFLHGPLNLRNKKAAIFYYLILYSATVQSCCCQSPVKEKKCINYTNHALYYIVCFTLFFDKLVYSWSVKYPAFVILT